MKLLISLSATRRVAAPTTTPSLTAQVEDWIASTGITNMKALITSILDGAAALPKSERFFKIKTTPFIYRMVRVKRKPKKDGGGYTYVGNANREGTKPFIVTYSTDIEACHNVAEDVELNDYVIVKKKFKPTDMLLNFDELRKVVNPVKKGSRDRYEHEVWINPSAYYTTYTEKEEVFNSLKEQDKEAEEDKTKKVDEKTAYKDYLANIKKALTWWLKTQPGIPRVTNLKALSDLFFKENYADRQHDQLEITHKRLGTKPPSKPVRKTPTEAELLKLYKKAVKS